ncbi:MAG: beta-lactamase family protein [Cellulomonadaceae bacterium]|nr:beta-lactamase family protein [Cellulomonadaceae bacterium]
MNSASSDAPAPAPAPASFTPPADFSGVIHVVRNGEVLLSQAHGFADIANERPNRLDTRFATASAGKALVAVGVLSLIAAGRVSLDTRVGDVLSAEVLGVINPDVTVRHLLTHTSGIGDYFDESVMDDYEELWADFPNYRVRTGTDLLPRFNTLPATSAPGTTFAYNNAGYVLLGLVVEKTVGTPLDEFLAQAVLAPAGMTASGWFELDRLPGNCANAYIFCDDAWRTNIYSVPAKGIGDGGAFLTAEDVVRFWTALVAGDIIPAAWVDQAFSVQATGTDEDGDEEHYGFGFWLAGDDAQMPCFMGEDPGVTFMTSRDPDGLIIVAASNTGDDVWDIHSELHDIYTA